jgi:hypothetical protein
LDEPTSGLDSKVRISEFNNFQTALNIIEFISELSKTNRTIVMTIHQPRSDIIDLIDEMLFLTEGKVQKNEILIQIVFYGASSSLFSYFDGVGCPIPIHSNPVDFVIDLITESSKEISDEKRVLEKFKINKLVEEFNQHEKENLDSIPVEDIPSFTKFPKHSNWWIFELFVLTIRSFLMVLRNPTLTFVRLIQVLVMSFMIGLLYIERIHGQKIVRNTLGAIFFILIQ